MITVTEVINELDTLLNRSEAPDFYWDDYVELIGILLGKCNKLLCQSDLDNPENYHFVKSLMESSKFRILLSEIESKIQRYKPFINGDPSYSDDIALFLSNIEFVKTIMLPISTSTVTMESEKLNLDGLLSELHQFSGTDITFYTFWSFVALKFISPDGMIKALHEESRISESDITMLVRRYGTAEPGSAWNIKSADTGLKIDKEDRESNKPKMPI